MSSVLNYINSAKSIILFGLTLLVEKVVAHIYMLYAIVRPERNRKKLVIIKSKTMRKTILILLATLPTLVFGQETKKVTVESSRTATKEVYFVLLSDGKTKEGSYQKLGYKDAVLINGSYKSGLKDGMWTMYRWGGKIKTSQGTYSEDKRIGVWEFYNYKGEVEQKYDFTKNEIVDFKLDDKEKKKEYRIIKGTDTTKVILDRPPIYIGGSISMFESMNIVYPQEEKEAGISGTVYTSFIIDSNGKASNHRITKGLSSGCDKEALRVVKGIPDNWLPGLLNGQTVNVEYIFPLKFTLR